MFNKAIPHLRTCHLLLLLLFAAISASALPMGPDGKDLRELCSTSGGALRHQPICREFLLARSRDGEDGGDDAFCQNMCDIGAIVENCDCSSNSTSSTTAPSAPLTTTDLCDYLCRIGEGGSVCTCGAQPPAFHQAYLEQYKRKEEEEEASYI